MYDRLLLDITSPYGDKGGTHPKVVNFKSPWHGYRYWMTYSPYPKHKAKYENPVIIASNNLVDWEYPNSPIEKNILDDSYVNEKMYNSDPHLVYSPGNDTLEVWWRLVNDINNNVTIYRRCSQDGVTWSAREIMLYSNDRKAQDFVSPSILIIDNNYYIYYVHRRQIHLLTLTKCSDNNSYAISAPNTLDIVDNDCSPWHMDAIFHSGKIIIVYCGYLKKNGWARRFPMHLYLVCSFARILSTGAFRRQCVF